MSTEMTYGGYSFVPVPFMNITERKNKTGAGEILGKTYDINLLGDFVVLGTGSILSMDALQDALLSGLADQGNHFHITCGGIDILSCHPRINEINFPEGNWVQNSKYSIAMEFDGPPTSGSDYISDFSEEWNFEVADDKPYFRFGADTLPFTARLTHSLGATGKTIYISGSVVKPAWQQARNYIEHKVGYDEEFVTNSGIIGFSQNYFAPYNHFRTVQIGEQAGTYNLTESWVLLGSGAAGNATEDFTISVREASDTPLRTVSVEGSIQGLETRNYTGGVNVVEHPYVAASGYWNTIEGRLIDRANTVLDDTFTARDLNTIALSKTIGHNIRQGVITYSVEYDTRNQNCLLQADGSPVYSESIVIGLQNQVDIFAQIFVLGKIGGPVAQDLETKTVGVKTLSIESVSLPGTGCPTSSAMITSLLNSVKPTNVEDVVNAVEETLTSSYGTVWQTENTENVDIKSGRFSKNVTWNFTSCY